MSTLILAILLAVGGIQIPLLVQNSPENPAAMTSAELNAYLSDCVAMGVGAVTTMPTSLRWPYGDAPDAASELSLWRVANDPASGIDPAKAARWAAHLEEIYRWGLVPHIPLLEQESQRLPFADELKRTYAKAVTAPLAGRPAILDVEECQWDATTVTMWLAMLRELSPSSLLALHNPTWTGEEEGLFGPQIGNPDLDVLMLQVVNPADAGDRVAHWRARLADADHEAIIVVLEPGGTGIEPDWKRDPRMVEWWVRYPIHAGAQGVGAYFGDADQTARSADVLARRNFYIESGQWLWPKTKLGVKP